MFLKVRKGPEDNFDEALITYKKPRSVVAEAYRVLCTNLGFAGVDKSLKTILITSAQTQDGKSTIAANLAVATAQAGFKVILVDCDLRKPVQHKIFQIPNTTGFTNCIITNADVERTAHSLSVNNLKILTCGPIPPNPTEILNSERSQLLWNNLRANYDYVFIDSPPILAAADASILASRVDGVIMVIRSGATRIEAAVEVKNQLAKANSHLIGVVLNRAKISSKSYYSYYSSECEINAVY